MTKYFIYWLLYSSNLGGGAISGAVEVTDKTVTSYIYNEGYITWDIVSAERVVIRPGTKIISEGIFVLDAAGLRSVMVVSTNKIEHHIETDPPTRIVMKVKQIEIKK
jgi:hypothetical protein